ncbi:MAG: RNA polymerase sigma factor [Saprospiraceae bacterium]|nr:RNA polymerase sigma factor [Saprospiraceae bacterium]
MDQFTNEFQQIKPQLRSYLLRMTASVTDTDDILQDTWIKASQNLASFQGNSSLKTWIFAIASNLAKDNLRFKKRWTEDVTDICKQEALGNRTFFETALHINATSPQGNFEIREHVAFCFTCISKSLPLPQQIALFLKEVYEFKVQEIAIIMDTSEAMVKYYLHLSRNKMMEVFDRRCALINKEGICHQCSELNGIFNPKQAAQEAIIKVEMARAATSEDRERLLDLRMKILHELDPFESGGAALQLHHLEHNREVMERLA